MKEKGIRFKILVRFFTLSCIALLIHALIGYFYSQNVVTKIEESEAKRTMELLSRSLYQYMVSGSMDLIQNTFSNLREAEGAIKLIVLSDYRGRITRSTNIDMIGKKLPREFESERDFLLKRKDDRIVSIMVLRNSKECVKCHREVVEGQKLGVLAAVFQFQAYKSMLDKNFVNLLLFSVVIVFLLISALYYILTKDVIEKVVYIASDVLAMKEGKVPQFKGRSETTEIGYITKVFEEVYFSVRKLIEDITFTTSELEKLSEKLNSMSFDQEKSASNISSSIHQISSTMEELAVSSKRVHEQTVEVVKKSRDILEISKQGDEALERNRSNMERVKEITKNLSSQVLVLSEHIKEVEGIVEMVGELSDKTDLLAINASIEAAKGGEENRSFQVVAEEIRRLADLSKSSLDKITSIIEEIEDIVNKLVFSSEEELKSIEESFSLINVAYNTMKSLVSALKEAVDSFSFIDSATKEQSEAVKQVAESLSMLYKESGKATQLAKKLHEHSGKIAEISSKLRKFLEESPIITSKKDE